MAGGGEDGYKIKRISFLGRFNVPVVVQNQNGPCPLLAICMYSSNQYQVTRSLSLGCRNLSGVRFFMAVGPFNACSTGPSVYMVRGSRIPAYQRSEPVSRFPVASFQAMSSFSETRLPSIPTFLKCLCLISSHLSPITSWTQMPQWR